MFFLFNDTAATEIYTLSLHDALPIWIPTATPARFILPDGTVEVEGVPYGQQVGPCNAAAEVVFSHKTGLVQNAGADARSEEHTSELQSRQYLVCRLLLEKKQNLLLLY